MFKARQRLGPEPLKVLFEAVAARWLTGTRGALYRDWRLVSLDGTCVDVADTPSNEAAFGRPALAVEGAARSRRCAWWGWASAVPMR